ncbi:MAG: hypothetical protein GF393_03345, partial [Armatimonadia bacterium]|nr:hypothetical protein [Armatimonadia bacterium]
MVIRRHLYAILALVSLGIVPVFAQQQVLRFEAEDITQPASAWQENTDSDDHWNLWSTDQNADEKWSEGIVLRSPEVMADRESPEEGAPPLHVTVTGIPEGTWQVSVGGLSRAMGISLDGETWQKQTSRTLGEFEITDGRFEVWLDDRYVYPDNPGPTYFDYLQLAPAVPAANGVQNGGFEFALEGADEIPGWTWWTREDDVGSAELVIDAAREGERMVRIRHTGERDFAFSNRGRLPVEFRDKLTASARVRTEGEGQVNLAFVARHDGETVSWDIGSDHVTGTSDWTKLQARAKVRRNIDEVY